MSRQVSSHATPAAAKVAPAAASVMQLKCACGNRSAAGGECAACGKDKLQRKANGQAAMGAALSTPRGSVMQAKLAIGASDDPLEREADRVADQVLALPAHPVVRGAAQRIQRFAGQPAAQAATAPESVDRVLAGSGKPLDAALRQDMESRFGHDFSRVRVHSDGAAGQSASHTPGKRPATRSRTAGRRPRPRPCRTSTSPRPTTDRGWAPSGVG